MPPAAYMASSDSESEDAGEAEHDIAAILARVRAMPEYREWEQERGAVDGWATVPADPELEPQPAPRRDDPMRGSGPWASEAKRDNLRASIESLREVIGVEDHHRYRCLRRLFRAWQHRVAGWLRMRALLVKASNHWYRRTCRSALGSWRRNVRARRLARLGRAWRQWAGIVEEKRREGYVEGLATELAHRGSLRRFRRAFRAWRAYTSERGRRHRVGGEIERRRRETALANSFGGWREALPALRRRRWCEWMAAVFRRRQLLKAALAQFHYLLLARCRSLKKAKLYSRFCLWHRTFAPWAERARRRAAARREAEARGDLALARRAWAQWAAYTLKRRRRAAANGRALNFRRRRLLAPPLLALHAAAREALAESHRRRALAGTALAAWRGRSQWRRQRAALERLAGEYRDGPGARLRAADALRRWLEGAREARREHEATLRADALRRRFALPRAWAAMREHARRAARRRLARELADAHRWRCLAGRAMGRWRAAARAGLLRQAQEGVAALFHASQARRRAGAVVRAWRAAAAEAAAEREWAASRLRELTLAARCLRALQRHVRGGRAAEAAAERRAAAGRAARALRAWRTEAGGRAERRALLEEALERRRERALRLALAAWERETSASLSSQASAASSARRALGTAQARIPLRSAPPSSPSLPSAWGYLGSGLDIVPRGYPSPSQPPSSPSLPSPSLPGSSVLLPQPRPRPPSRPLSSSGRPPSLEPPSSSPSSPSSSLSSPSRASSWSLPPRRSEPGHEPPSAPDSDSDADDSFVTRATRAAVLFHCRRLLVRHFLSWRYAAIAVQRLRRLRPPPARPAYPPARTPSRSRSSSAYGSPSLSSASKYS